MAAPGAPATAPALSDSPRRGGDIAVVVVLYEGAEWIERCLGSVCSAYRNLHLIVVDNASTDDGPARVKAGFPQATLLSMGANFGFGRGCNAGIRLARERGCRFVLLLNQDAWMAPDGLDMLADLLDDETAFGAASPLHCTADFLQLDPRTTANYLRPHAIEYLSDATLAQVRRAYRVRGLNAAAWLVRMSTFERFGGFDPLFFMYCEDDDLLDRWQRHDLHFALVPAARVAHARESGVPRPQGGWAQVRHQARVLTSQRLLDLKRLYADSRPAARAILAAGVTDALAEGLVQRSARAFAVGLLATLGAVRLAPQVRRHAQLCLRPGPHFLEADGSGGTCTADAASAAKTT